jgi:hypothetical protein
VDVATQGQQGDTVISKETIRAYRLTDAAVEVLEESGYSNTMVDADFCALVGDGYALLVSCLDGADSDRRQGWTDYVACLVAAKPGHPNHTEAERRAINA